MGLKNTSLLLLLLALGNNAMAELALRQAKHSEIKAMAQDIIDAQTREITTMRGWLQSWYSIQQ